MASSNFSRLMIYMKTLANSYSLPSSTPSNSRDSKCFCDRSASSSLLPVLDRGPSSLSLKHAKIPRVWDDLEIVSETPKEL